VTYSELHGILLETKASMVRLVGDSQHPAEIRILYLHRELLVLQFTYSEQTDKLEALATRI
jgi:hypothetical protein